GRGAGKGEGGAAVYSYHSVEYDERVSGGLTSAGSIAESRTAIERTNGDTMVRYDCVRGTCGFHVRQLSAIGFTRRSAVHNRSDYRKGFSLERAVQIRTSR